jgi:hypothetical protein
MKKNCLFALFFVAVLLIQVPAHDLFLKLESYFVGLNERSTIKILNGSFQGSEGPVNFARLADLSVISPSGQRSKVAEADLSKDDKTSVIGWTPTEAGNYVFGLSTMTREIELSGKDFNGYLEEDGIPDTLAERQKRNETEKAARERYSKHVKAIVQAGDTRTANYKKPLGYPVEIVPRTNPYSLKVGDTFEFVCLKDGKPIDNQYVMTGYDDETNLRLSDNVRTNRKGIGKMKILSPGKWYVKFIHMTRLDDPRLNYESKWASLTFQVK